jgi:hypothetical protein
MEQKRILVLINQKNAPLELEVKARVNLSVSHSADYVRVFSSPKRFFFSCLIQVVVVE